MENLLVVFGKHTETLYSYILYYFYDMSTKRRIESSNLHTDSVPVGRWPWCSGRILEAGARGRA